MVNRFGTTSDMIIQNVEENGVAYLLAIDDKGLYMTTANKVDRQMADTNRYTSARKDVSKRLESLGLNPEELFSQNKHLIKVQTGEAKRVNPLKASKRAARG